MFGVSFWTTVVIVGTGAVVTSLVIGSAVVYTRLRRRPAVEASREEDLPWDELLGMLEKRNRDRAAAGLPLEQPTEEELKQLVANLPAVPDAAPADLPEDREFLSLGGNNKRTGRRRWGNPTEVHIRSTLWVGRLHGLVVNRSTGGLGIFLDVEIPPGTPLQLRAAEAPGNVPAIEAEVRHCRKVGKGFLFGCQFSDDVPWNARVWFG
jgi:PilZ domain